MRWSRSSKLLAIMAASVVMAVGAVGVVQIRARSDPYAQLKHVCQVEIERVNRSPAWVVYCDRSALVGRPSSTHLKLQRRVAGYAVEMHEGRDPPLGVVRFEVAKARTTLENDRTLAEAKADADFEAAFTEEHEHQYAWENGRWVEGERRQHDAFLDWLRGETAWHDCRDRSHGLPPGLIVEKEPDPLAGW